MYYFEVSSKDNKNIKEMFDFIVDRCYTKFSLEKKKNVEHPSIILKKKYRKRDKGCWDFFKNAFSGI